MDRDTIFISHATPDDNEFVRWLGGELTARGYTVWADVFHLKGGTPFWTTIEDVLRKRAIKVIFVVSRGSIDPARSGVRSELSVADGLRKALKDPGFIVPVRIDDTPFDELPIQVHQLNTLDFSADWDMRLTDLLDTLEEATVPRNGEAGAPAGITRSGAVVDDTRSTEPIRNAVRDRASLAVLPFANLGGDPSDDYFADGIVEDMTTALSRFGTFLVVSRSSAFVYKNRAVDVREAAKELGVRYVLEGGVRRQDKRVRVTAKLLDAKSGSHLWADKFDGNLDDIFDFQDQITETVVGLIEPKIRLAEIERARRKRPESLDAYDLYLQALPLVYGMNQDGFADAFALLSRAIALDPSFALAMAYAAWTLEKRITLGLPPLGRDDAAECLRLAQAALVADGEEPIVQVIAGWLRIVASDFEPGLAAVRRAVAANPNNLVVLNLSGAANMIGGDLDEASECYLRAIRLSPNAPDIFWSLSGEGTVQLYRGNFEGAIEWCRRSLATFNDWPMTYWALIAAYAHLDRMDEARAALRKLLTLAPQTTAATMDGAVTRDPARWEIQMSGLRKAGLPEV